MTDRYADADPEETVSVTGVGHMTLRRAVHKADDCVCVVIRASATAFPALLGSVDLGKVAPELDRAAWLSAMMSIASRSSATPSFL